MGFNPQLLQVELLKYDAEYLLQIGIWIFEKINSPEFYKFPATIIKLKQKHKQFMEMYELSKIKEEENKEKKFIKTKQPFYRFRSNNKNEQYLFDRLEHRRKISKSMRSNNEISKIQR